MTFLRSLSHRAFALLWTGQTVSRLGDSLYRVALAWWMLEETGSATAMGAVMIFSFTPMLIFLLIGGVLVDRLPRLRVMLVCDVASGAVIGTVALLAFADRLEVWHVYAASLLFGLVEAFFFPAYTAAVPALTPTEALPSANSLTSLSHQITGIVGPAVAAAIVAAGGTPLAFLLDGLSFFLSAAFLLPLLRQDAAPAPAGDGRTALADLRDGLSLVLASPWLWITIALFAFTNVALSGPRAVALPFLIQDNLGAGVEALGLISSSAAAGSMVGTIWLGRYARLRRRGLVSYLCTAVTGLSFFVFGLAVPLSVIIGAAFVGGLSISMFGLIWTNTLQELVPGEKLGRVSSIDALGSFVLLPVGYAVAGWATDLVGAPLVFAVGGAVTTLLALAGLLHPAIRHLD
jgi:MFS family permease